jgi:DNA-binding SARP family transcriptional activator
MLGEFAIDQVDLSRIRSRKSRTALKVLALARGRPVSVDRLVECLWPDGTAPREPEREVAVNLSRARSVLGRDRIVRSDAGYRLVFDWLDLDVLDELADEARRRLSGSTGRRPSARRRRCATWPPRLRWPSAIRDTRPTWPSGS